MNICAVSSQIYYRLVQLSYQKFLLLGESQKEGDSRISQLPSDSRTPVRHVIIFLDFEWNISIAVLQGQNREALKGLDSESECS